jgi:hypothetical protein
MIDGSLESLEQSKNESMIEAAKTKKAWYLSPRGYSLFDLLSAL